MSGSTRDLTDSHIKELIGQSSETIEAVLARMNQDLVLVEAVRRLLFPTDSMVEEFLRLRSEDPETSELVLHVAIAVLVNTQSLQSLRVEDLRRRRERN
jgi:hypothetical protein